MIEVHGTPNLRDAVLVVALSGWVDAGRAGAGAAGFLRDHLVASRELARIDLEGLVDQQQARPIVRLADGVTRTLEWPAVELVAGRAGRDVVVCRGPEPSLRWREITDALVGLVRTLDVRLAVTLGGMPVPVSHRRPVRVLATATSHSLAQELGARRADYSGPTGMQTVLQVALGEAGVPAAGLWAQVPHYVAGSPSPPAVRALLERLRDVARLDLDVGALDRGCDEYRREVDEGLESRPDVAELVRAIEAGDDELPTGDELASEIERFLRDE
ncbi:MAG: PAC2 family protein [Acidimicrobiia bacterium]|nr:PAC2 family protein [Acidimicrobiia bacterium]